jgi:6-phosphogluconolactonase (cycloisomerase 2 family)
MEAMMRRREFLGGLAGVTAAMASRPWSSADAAGAPTFMYVGSFTGKDRGHGEGISVYHRRRESDPWTLVQLLKEVADPSFLIIDRAGRHLYSAQGDGTQVTSYRIDPATGRLAVLNRQPTGGRNGVHLAIDATNRFLALANYATGHLIVLPINADGSLAPVSDRAAMAGDPGPHRIQQESSHPHHCPFDPTGRFIVVPDKGLDRLFLYRLDASSGRLVPGDPPSVTTRAGAGPRHADFHPTRPFAYVINELDSTVATYRFDPAEGVLKPLQILPTLPPTYTGNNTCAEIAVAPSGRFVYGSNRGHDSIAIFAVDGQTGLLTSVGWQSTQGRSPRFFGLDPSGTHLYAANQATDTVVIFRVDDTAGGLTPTGEVVKVATPSTIVFKQS